MVRPLPLVLLAALVGAPSGAAQVCESAYLKTQQEVDQFDCEVVTGWLSIYPGLSPGQSDITNLDGLSELRSAGVLSITDHRDLESLAGLEALESVGSLYLRSTAVRSVEALAVLAGPLEDLVVQDNDFLMSLDGLQGVTAARHVTVRNNDRLEDVDGLSGMEQVHGKLWVLNNDALADLDGLAPSSYVGGEVVVAANDALSDCGCGLYGKITGGTVFGEIRVEDNAPGCNSPADVAAPAPGSCRFAVAAEDAPGLDGALTVGPNPTAGAATLRAGLEAPGLVRVTLRDALGRLVRVLHDGPAAGALEVGLDASALAPGVYVVRLEAPGRVEAAPLTVAR